MKIIRKRNKKLSELIAPLKGRYFQSPEINIKITDKTKALHEAE
ncbi:unnamed protein product, partial [marine sediment metagenome]